MTMERNNSDSFNPSECASITNSSLTHSGNLPLISSVALPMRDGSPVEREKMVSWESLAVASLWIRCSGAVADELRALADELVTIVQPAVVVASAGIGSSGQISQ